MDPEFWQDESMMDGRLYENTRCNLIQVSELNYAMGEQGDDTRR